MFNALVPELAVRNCHDSLRFYCGVLGFTLAYERPEEGFAFIQLGDAQMMLDQIGAGRSFDNNMQVEPRHLGQGLNLQIIVPKLDPLLAALAGGGIPLFLDPEVRAYRRGHSYLLQRQFVVGDPDGYLLRFCEAPHIAPATSG